MQKEKEKILKLSQVLFLKEGFSHTSMDNIASSLRISKKTIYKHFESKEFLLKISVIDFMKSNNDKMKQMINSDENAVVKAFGLFNFIGMISLNISDHFISDLKNFAPELWKEMDKLRIKFLKENLTKIIEQGKKEGYFIDESSFLIINTFISTIRGIVNPEIILRKNISIEKAFIGSMKILMNGILTSKGKRIFKSLNNGVGK